MEHRFQPHEWSLPATNKHKASTGTRGTPQQCVNTFFCLYKRILSSPTNLTVCPPKSWSAYLLNQQGTGHVLKMPTHSKCTHTQKHSPLNTVKQLNWEHWRPVKYHSEGQQSGFCQPGTQWCSHCGVLMAPIWAWQCGSAK